MIGSNFSVKLFTDDKDSNWSLPKEVANELSIDVGFISEIDKGNVSLSTMTRGHEAIIIMSLIDSHKKQITEFAIDALHRSGATGVRLVSPFFPYTQQVERDRRAVPYSVLARIFKALGLMDFMTFDAHTSRLGGGFKSIKHISPDSFIYNNIKECFCSYKYRKKVVFAVPHVGNNKIEKGMEIWRKLVERGIDVKFAVFDKDIRKCVFVRGLRKCKKEKENNGRFINFRDCSYSIVTQNEMVLRDSIVILYDDILNSGNTISTACSTAEKLGAAEIHAIVSHWGDKAVKRLSRVRLQSLRVTNSVNIKEKEIEVLQKAGIEVFVFSLGSIIADEIKKRIYSI